MDEKQHWSQFLTYYFKSVYNPGECAKYDSFHQFWMETKEAHHMLCIAGIWSKREPLVLTACACARLALPYVRVDNEMPRIAIETAEAWARGEADIERVKVIADATFADIDSADYYAAISAAYAAWATYSTIDAAHAAYAAYYASCAANAVFTDIPYSGNTIIYNQTLEKCANIVRQMLPEPPFERYYKLKAFL